MVNNMSLEDNYQDSIDKAVELLGTTEHSSTFRKGEIGNWRDEFTSEIRIWSKQ